MKVNTYLISRYRLILSACLGMLACLGANAVESPAVDAAADAKTILILNSYNENSPWSGAMVNPINNFVAQDEKVNVEIENLNSALITDSTTYQKVCDNIMRTYDDRAVDYIVFIGNPAFTLRDEIKRKWGDIPMLLITRDLTLAPKEYYYSGFDKPLPESSFPSISTLQSEYNFTAVYVPDLYKETIDMMIDLIPDMKEMVFFADAIYFNRTLAWNIEQFLSVKYPDITFRWVQASHANARELQYYLVNRAPQTGLLLSSWFYEQTNALGYPVLVSSEMSLVSSSINPVFSLRRAFMNLGAIGGVYTDQQVINDAILSNIKAMLEGRQMRDIDFYVTRDPKQPTLNYEKLRDYGIKTSMCPPDTVYINKPLTYWEKYYWQTLVTIFCVILLMLYFWRRTSNQKRKINLLSRHMQFVDNMPIPYTKAKVIYNEDSTAILNIKYTMTNQAFDDIISENADPSKPYLLFSPEFISEKTTEMIESGKAVSFPYYFDKTKKHYIFTLCLVDAKRRKNRDLVDTIDIFALDVTQKQQIEDQLKDITERLDMTIDVANLIPWEWDMKTDVMTFDAISMYQRMRRTVEGNLMDEGQTKVSVAEFMRQIHPDDKQKVRELRENLFLNKVDHFTIEYRLLVARQNQDTVEWVEVKGAVKSRDEQGLPVLVLGSLNVITDRKQQELEVSQSRILSHKAKEFMSNISHRVRSQLNAIVGFANLMSETDDAEKRREFVEIIEDNNRQLLSFIDETAGENPANPENAPIPAPAPETQGHKQAPAAPAPQPAPSSQPAHAPKADETATHAPAARNADRKVILVAEDIEGNFLLLKHFIPRQYEIIHAWTGKEAVEMYHEHHPDIILMDIGMPVMDGYKATSEIRKADKDVPIVAVTAYTFASERELIMTSGFNDYISKPVAKDIIVDTLKHYLN